MGIKIIIPIFILIISNFAVQFAEAVPAAPSPFCEITAKVVKIEKIRTHFDPISYCSGRENFEYYHVILNISEITTYRQEGVGSCDNAYKENAEKGEILHLQEYNKTPVSNGQKIKAIINYRGDECWGGFFLGDIQIIPDEIVKKENTTEGNITPVKDIKIKDIGSQYYIVPSILFLFAVLRILIKRKKG